MKKLALEDLGHLKIKEAFILFKESYFKLFYQDECLFDYLISLNKISRLKPGLRKLLELFLEHAKIKIDIIDANKLIKDLVENLETALVDSEKEMLGYIAKHISFNKKNYSNILQIFNTTIEYRAPIIKKHLEQVFNNHSTIKRYMKNNLKENDYDHCSDIISKQFFYRIVLDKTVLARVSDDVHIKGRRVAKRTKTLNKIAEINDYLEGIRAAEDKIEENKVEFKLNRLLNNINITLSPEAIKNIIYDLRLKSTTSILSSETSVDSGAPTFFHHENKDSMESKNIRSNPSPRETPSLPHPLLTRDP
jgi:hypothetical protein